MAPEDIHTNQGWLNGGGGGDLKSQNFKRKGMKLNSKFQGEEEGKVGNQITILGGGKDIF